MNKKLLIGFIGQGWVGKNYADDFENRKYNILRYSLDEPYVNNKEKIKYCDIVFIAVPTPTRISGFDNSALISALDLVGENKIAVIKSTLPIGETSKLQSIYKKIIIVHSPEFLSELTAAYDAAHPDRNIIGIPKINSFYKKIASQIINILPKAPFELICSAEEAEFIKYSHNINGYIQVVFSNILYDISKHFNMDWNTLERAFRANPFMSHRYLKPIDKNGRGAGGNCFIKDFEAFIKFFDSNINDKKTLNVLTSIRDKNINLLLESGKDIELIKSVYGNNYIEYKNK